MQTKICTKCNTEKNVEEFAWKIKSKGKRCAECKSCHNIYNRKHYQDNVSYYVAKSKVNKKTRRKRIDKLFEDYYTAIGGCCKCDEDDPTCMDFHHIDPNDKEFTISEGKHNYSIERIKKEINKCIVICANCHRKLHAGKFILTKSEINQKKVELFV